MEVTSQEAKGLKKHEEVDGTLSMRPISARGKEHLVIRSEPETVCQIPWRALKLPKHRATAAGGELMHAAP